MKIAKDYLSDGAFVEWNGYAIVLTTSNGLHDTNTIELDAYGIAALEQYIKRVRTPNCAATSRKMPDYHSTR